MKYRDMAICTPKSLINFLLPITDKFSDLKHTADEKIREMVDQMRLDEVQSEPDLQVATRNTTVENIQALLGNRQPRVSTTRAFGSPDRLLQEQGLLEKEREQRIQTIVTNPLEHSQNNLGGDQ